MSRSRIAWAMAALGLVVGAVAAAAPESSGSLAVVDAPAVRLADHSRALLVSDSAWLGIKTYGAVDAVQGFDHMLDLASCRRRVAPSCRNFDGYVPITLLEEVRWREGSYSTLIVATGYNDGEQRFLSDIDTIVDTARSYGYERVVWLTLRADVSYVSPGGIGFAEVFERTNALLRSVAESGRHPELIVADWAEYAALRDDWFARDGIHLRFDGPWAAADYISRKIAHLDGTACARPVADGLAPADPCPDPDVTGPVIDIPGVYPRDQTAPRDPFVLEWEGKSSWPAPPWWER